MKKQPSCSYLWVAVCVCSAFTGAMLVSVVWEQHENKGDPQAMTANMQLLTTPKRATLTTEQDFSETQQPIQQDVDTQPFVLRDDTQSTQTQCRVSSLCLFALTGDPSHLRVITPSHCNIKCAKAAFDLLSQRSLDDAAHAVLRDWAINYPHNDSLLVLVGAHLDFRDDPRGTEFLQRVRVAAHSIDLGDQVELASLGYMPQAPTGISSRSLSLAELRGLLQPETSSSINLGVLGLLPLDALLELGAQQDLASHRALEHRLADVAQNTIEEDATFRLLNAAEQGRTRALQSAVQAWASGQLSGERFSWLESWLKQHQFSPNAVHVARLALAVAEDQETALVVMAGLPRY